MRSFIKIYENALDVKVCKDAIKRFEADPRKAPGLTAYGNIHPTKRSMDLNISGKPEWNDIDLAIFQSLAKAVDKYNADCDFVLNWVNNVEHKDSGYLIQKYKKKSDEGFDWHADNGMNTPTIQRFLTAIWYLNDVKKGGETEFKHHDIIIRPKAGSLLLFPPFFEYIHRGKNPTSNDKYIITTFMIAVPPRLQEAVSAKAA